MAGLVLLFLLGASPVCADQGFGAVQHYVFIPGRDTSIVAVVDTETDRLAGTLELGLNPRQIEISSALAKLVAVDGVSSRLVIDDLVTLQIRSVPLDFTPRMVQISADGLTLAVADPSAGIICFMDLLLGREIARSAGLPPFSDMMFDDKGSSLFIASDRLNGIGVVDAVSVKLLQTIPTASGREEGAVAFTRAPNGRSLFVKAANDGPITVIDLKTGRAPRTLVSAGGAATAYPSGTGRYLLLPDESGRHVSILLGDGDKIGAVLDGAPSMGPAYSAWFDSVAFVPSIGTEGRLLVYDLDKFSRGTDIVLAVGPGRGAVTPDGAKLYLPLAKSDALAVIDARQRRLSSTIRLPIHPGAAVMAGSYGICH